MSSVKIYNRAKTFDISNTMSARLAYPDVCKFVAMFAVTCGHCSQAISHLTWSNFIGGIDYTIAFHMPLFFIVSGFFINLDKIRSTSFIFQLRQKATRLLLPAICWYLLYCIAILHIPHLTETITFYWFLTSLFACHIIIVLCAKIFKNDMLCWLMALVTSLLISIPLLEKISFMMPFIIIGKILFTFIEKCNARLLFVLSAVDSVICLYFWQTERTVYLCPFIINHIDLWTITNYLYRIITGTSISICVILIVKWLSQKYSLSSLKSYGSITLVIYTFSLVFVSVMNKLLYDSHLNTNEYIVLDILSVCMCLLIFFMSKYLVFFLRKSKVLKLCLCGEQ